MTTEVATASLSGYSIRSMVKYVRTAAQRSCLADEAKREAVGVHLEAKSPNSQSGAFVRGGRGWDSYYLTQ
jgi:hypothetical protein